jgi:hypothetical protein
MEDVSAEVAGLISSSKVFGGSENIRHGKYKFLIKRIFAQLVESDMGKHKMAFWELTPLESHHNLQVEGDRVDYISPQQPGVGPLKDDGTKPNVVGSNCALKVDFDGNGARSAGSNIKAAILGLFGKRDGEISEEEINKTWVDLARMKDLKIGDAIGIDPQTSQPIFAKVAKQANWACGMIIYCDTMAKRKKTPNDKGAYVTKLLWDCKGSPPGVGENAWDLVAKRRTDIEAARTDDEDDSSSTSTPSPYSQQQTQTMTQQTAPQPPAPPPPAPPPPPAVSAFVPPPPWVKHPSAAWGATPEAQFYWDQDSQVKSAAQLHQARNGA